MLPDIDSQNGSVTVDQRTVLVGCAFDDEFAVRIETQPRPTAAEPSDRCAGEHLGETIEATQGIGTQVLKFRGGMPLLGMTRVFGLYRFANSMALLDADIRKVGPEDAMGGRGFDNYSWHTDLPPGHPMVTGQQTIDFDLNSVEHCKTVVVWGMNWITTKMPDAHWLTGECGHHFSIPLDDGAMLSAYGKYLAGAVLIHWQP